MRVVGREEKHASAGGSSVSTEMGLSEKPENWPEPADPPAPRSSGGVLRGLLACGLCRVFARQNGVRPFGIAAGKKQFDGNLEKAGDGTLHFLIWPFPYGAEGSGVEFVDLSELRQRHAATMEFRLDRELIPRSGLIRHLSLRSGAVGAALIFGQTMRICRQRVRYRCRVKPEICFCKTEKWFYSVILIG